MDLAEIAQSQRDNDEGDKLRIENVQQLNEENLIRHIHANDDSNRSDQRHKRYNMPKTYSNESIESTYSQDNDELKKKMMHGFDESKDLEDMVCKLFSKENKYPYFDDYEKISDLNAYQVMF